MTIKIKMLEKSDVKITRYGYGNYYVDIVKEFTGNGEGYYEAWLGKWDFGISEFMFGFKATRKEFMSFVDADIDHCIEIFEKKYNYESEVE